MEHPNFRKNSTRYLWYVLAFCFILWGIFALLTPLTPGSWFLLAGLLMIFGKRKTENLIAKIIGKKWLTKLGIKRMLKKIDEVEHNQ